MPYLWRDIQKEWLLGQNVDYVPEDVVKAFNEIESVLAIDLSLATHIGRGPLVAIPIIELGRVLDILKEIPNGIALIEKIRDNNPFHIPPTNKVRKIAKISYKKTDPASEYSHALQVAKLAAHYRKHSCEVEIEPELMVNERKRCPDLRVKFDSIWVYFEVVSPNSSKEVQEGYRILERICNIAIGLKMDTLIEVYLFRDPNEEEIIQIIEKCKSMAVNSQEEFTFDKLAQIFVNSRNEERLPKFVPAAQEKRPILVVVDFSSKNINGSVHVRRVIGKMPITDERAQTVLSEKSQQLSRTDPGFIVIDVSDVPSGLKRWPFLISNRLQPNLNRRITGVLLVENHLSINKMITAKTLIRHPNPIHNLPEGFFDLTSSIS